MIISGTYLYVLYVSLYGPGQLSMNVRHEDEGPLAEDKTAAAG